MSAQTTSRPKVPVTIVTGFLGAGKTTLIRHAIENAGGRRLGLIVNEFGDLGVDGDILKSCDSPACRPGDVIELSNGCLCCTVADDFVPAIDALLARDPPPDHIVVETSGLALPKPLVKAFDWPDVRRRLTVDGVIAVVDAAAVAAGRFADDPVAVAAQRAADPTVEHDNPLEEVFEDQVACADLVILNKTDLVAAEALARVESEIARVAPRPVRILRTREGRLPVDVLLGVSAGAEDDLAARPSHHDGLGDHEHDDFDTIVVETPTVSDPAAFVTRLAAVADRRDVLRIKGFVAVEGKPMRMLVQGVGGRFAHHYDRPWRDGEERRGRLVVIARAGFDRAALAAEVRG